MNEGLRECQIAQQLDPNHSHLSAALYLARDYDSSIATLRIMLQRERFAELHGWLSVNYIKKGMHREAIQEWEQAYKLFGFREIANKMHRAYAASGYREAIRQLAKELEHLQATHQLFAPGQLATAYVILGDKDRAFYWLEQAYEHRDMVGADMGVYFLPADPIYDLLRSDPRFEDLLRRMGLPLSVASS